PSALSGEELDRGHVDLVEVGAFFAVDLDADEVVVEQASDLLVLKALVLHDVAPVARRVADAEEDGTVELAGAFQRLGAPGVPVDGVVGVLPQIGAGFVDEAIGEVAALAHGALRGRSVPLSPLFYAARQETDTHRETMNDER